MPYSASLVRLQVAAALAAAVLACPIAAHAVEPGLSAELSWERLDLPNTRFTYIFNNVSPNFLAPRGVVSKDQNHDGEVDGARLDLSWGARTILVGHVPIIAGVKGYFARHEGSQNSSCTSTSNSALCAHVPLFDPDPNTQQLLPYSTGSNIDHLTDVDTTTWGVALEGQSIAVPSSAGTLYWKAGAGYRRIDSEISLDGRRVSGGLDTPLPFSLNEDIETGYLGGYAGGGGNLPFGNGFALTYDGEIGVYWARTEYLGRYTQSGAAFAPFNQRQSLSLDRDVAAVIAAVKVGVEKEFETFKVGVFARGEYYSYAPEMQYNDVDRHPVNSRADGGHNDGTSITNGNAWTASVGARVSVPLTR